MMNTRKRREESKQVAVVVLEGTKICSENSGLVPLLMAMSRVVNPRDEIVVLAFVRSRPRVASVGGGGASWQGCDFACEPETYVRLLREEIGQRKELYLSIFRPFYHACKSNGVKFHVKIAAGCRPKDIIMEEANNVKATWIVVDRCFTSHLSLRMSGTNCNLSIASDNDEDTTSKNGPQRNEQPESSSPRSPKSPRLQKGPISAGSRPNREQTACNHYTDNEPPGSEISQVQDQNLDDQISADGQTLLKLQPLDLTYETIEEITERFKSRTCEGQNRNCTLYFGYFEVQKLLVLVKKYSKDSVGILESEMKAALLLQHRNIHTVIGYHKSERGIFLVFPLQREGTLDKYTSNLNRKELELTFQDKLKIAIGIAQGIRYMHEECIGGSISHGRLQPCNIFLTSNLQPMISGFEQATWLQFRQDLPASRNRYPIENCLEHGSMVKMKLDIYCFGVLLLRMFCKKSVAQDDKSLVEWARPLILDRAFHLLLEDENSEDLDMLDMLRVMAAARMCTMSLPISRPSISEVISILKGENFCMIQPSPSPSTSDYIMDYVI